MTTVLLPYVSGNSRGNLELTGPGITTLFDPDTQEVSINLSEAASSGQQVNMELFSLGTDFNPTVTLSSTGTDFGYNSSALFWTFAYTPQYANSILILRSSFQLRVQASTTASSGMWMGFYTSNTAGAAPMGPCNPVWKPGAMESVANYGNMFGVASGVVSYTNTSLNPVTFYVCGFILDNGATSVSSNAPIIFSSSSTATTFGGSMPSTVSILEVVS